MPDIPYRSGLGAPGIGFHQIVAQRPLDPVEAQLGKKQTGDDAEAQHQRHDRSPVPTIVADCGD